MAATHENGEHEERKGHGERVTRWERRVEIPMLLLAGAFLIAYAWPVIDQSLDNDLRSMLRTLSWTVWVAFAIDFFIRLYWPRTACATRSGTGTTSC